MTWLVMPNKDEVPVNNNNLYYVSQEHHLKDVVQVLASKNIGIPIEVYKLQEKHIGKGQVKITSYAYTENGEVLPK